MPSTALIVMPRSSRAWRGSEALWITAAGWASAAARRFGKAWVITPDRIAEPSEVSGYPLGDSSVSRSLNSNWMPEIGRQIAKDLVLWWNGNWKIGEDPARWSGEDISFVWEQHDIFPGPGRYLARKYGLPVVVFVHAPIIW